MQWLCKAFDLAAHSGKRWAVISGPARAVSPPAARSPWRTSP